MTSLRLLVPSVLLALLALVTACGSNAPEAGDTSSSDGPSQSPGTPADPGGAEIAAVSLDRSGGLKPTRVHRTFSTDGRPPRGFTSADVEAALEAAEQFLASGTSLAPVPSAACCDLYTYVVTITDGDGTSTSYQTVDGLNQPPVFENLLSALA